MIMTDDIATSYFQTQKKLSPKHARWQGFFIKFYYKLQYNAVISHVQGTLVDYIKEGMTHDPPAKTFIAYANDGKMRRFWMNYYMPKVVAYMCSLTGNGDRKYSRSVMTSYGQGILEFDTY